jgi:hypothetical protein
MTSCLVPWHSGFFFFFFFFRIHYRAPWGTEPYVALGTLVIARWVAWCELIAPFKWLQVLGLLSRRTCSTLGRVAPEASLCGLSRQAARIAHLMPNDVRVLREWGR